MLHRHKLLESENHVGEDVGDFRTIIRADFEDGMVQALEDTHKDGRLNAFREFVRKNRTEWPQGYFDLVMSQDSWGWYTVHFLTCTLRRMSPRWEHSANRLMHEFDMNPAEIPDGTEVLYR